MINSKCYSREVFLCSLASLLLSPSQGTSFFFHALFVSRENELWIHRGKLGMVKYLILFFLSYFCMVLAILIQNNAMFGYWERKSKFQLSGYIYIYIFFKFSLGFSASKHRRIGFLKWAWFESFVFLLEFGVPMLITAFHALGSCYSRNALFGVE